MSANARSEVDYLAFGDIRGNLEPCGCDPKTDLGGIRRLAAQIGRERALAKDFYVFNLGNNFPESNASLLSNQEKNKIPFIAESIVELKVDASLFNYSEDQQEQNRAVYLLTNRDNFKSHIILRDAVIFGYTSPTKKFKATSASSLQFKNKIEDIVKKIPQLKKVLLFSGSDADLNYLKIHFKFDSIISSNTSPIGTPTDKNEFEDEEKLLRKDIWMVPHGGQGLLRGGKMRLAAAPTIAQLFAKDDAKFKSNNVNVTWLKKDLDDESVLKDLFLRYRDLSKGNFLKLASERKTFLQNSKFIGSEACKSCHADSFAVWQNSAHAHAYATLEEKNQHQNSECVECHVVGYKEKGGFADIKSSPQFANVQCENCHGARREHAVNPNFHPVAKPREVCATCHRPPHSSEFNFEVYWPKIKHGKK